MINSKMVGLLVAAFVAGSFVASPELRAFAANTVFSTDIVDGQVKTADLAAGAVTGPKLGSNAVNSAKIVDGTVVAADIATDAVGAAEIQGVAKLIFAQCVLSSAEKTKEVEAGEFLDKICFITGADGDDTIVATLNFVTNECFILNEASPENGGVRLTFRNACDLPGAMGSSTGPIGIIVFDK